MCLRQKCLNSTTTKQKKQSEHNIPCQTPESNPGRLAPQSDALPVDHRDN